MKKLLIFITAFTLSSGAFAQDKMDKKMNHQTEKANHTKDHIMMMNGKMVMIKNGKSTPMSKDKTLSNGTMVKTDGTVKMKDGMTMKMKDGEMIYMNGKMGKM